MPVSFRHGVLRWLSVAAMLSLPVLTGTGLSGCSLATADDTRAPLVELLAPVATTPGAAPAAVDAAGDLAVRVAVTPRGTDNGISSVRLLVDNRPAGTATIVGTPTKNALGLFVFTYAATLDVRTLADGEHRFEVVAFDRFGARGTSTPVRLRVANGGVGIGPVARLTEPADGASVRGAVRVVVTPDAGEVVDRVDFLVDGQALATDSVAPFEWTWRTGLSGVGTHTLQGRAYEGATVALTNAATVTVTDTTAGGGGGGGPIDPPPTGSIDPNCTTAGCVRFRATTAAPLSAPLAVDAAGNVVAVTTGAQVAAWSPSGALRWTRSLTSVSRVAPLLGSDGTAYVVEESGRLVALSPDGATRWAFETGAAVTGGLALTSTGRLVFGDANGRLHAVGSVSGLEASGFPVTVSTAAITTPVAALPDGGIVLTSGDGRVYRFNADGTRRWVSAEAFGSLVYGPVLDVQEVGGLTFVDVYVINSGGRLVALDGASGASGYATILDGVPAAAPIVGTGGLVVTTTSLSVTAYRAPTTSGQSDIVWRYSALGGTASAPAFDGEGRVFVPTSTDLLVLTPQGMAGARYSTAPGTSAAAVNGRGTVYTSTVTTLVGLYTGTAAAPQGTWPMAGVTSRRTFRAGDAP